MLYVLHGTDTRKSRQKLQELTEVLLKKRPDASLVKFNTDSWSEKSFDEILSSTGLFAPKNIIVLDSLVTNKLSQDFLMEKISDMGASSHICIILEGKLTKELLKKIEKKAEKVTEHNLAEGAGAGAGVRAGAGESAGSSGSAKKKMPETFAFADALAMGDKKKAWVLYQHLQADGVASEEIHGVVWWQFKSMYLASLYDDAKSSGVNPYVFQNCKKFLKNWTPESLEQMLSRLVSMYHQAHRGEVDFKAEIEVMCLE